MPTITVAKLTAASRGYGRGPDNYVRPATWGISRDGTLVAVVTTDNRRFMEKAGPWYVKVIVVDGSTPRPYTYGKTRVEAVAKAVAYATALGGTTT